MAPNFFILGAAKAGTTFLYQYLKRHPDIYFPFQKEPQFFSDDNLYARGLEWYLDTYFNKAGTSMARGDATPHYLLYEKVARRLSHDLPRENHRFIVLLRDPVQRAYSLYWNMVHEGHETLSFEESLEREDSIFRDDTELARGSIKFSYVTGGLYAQQLNTYFKYFARENFMILLQDDLVDNMSLSVHNVLRFLRVEPGTIEQHGVPHNAAAQPRLRSVQHFLRKPNWVKRHVGKVLPHRVKHRLVERILRMNRRAFEYPPMDHATERKLRGLFSDDVTELQSLIGRDLSRWLNGQAR